MMCAMHVDGAYLSYALSARAKSGDWFPPHHSGLIHAALQLAEDALTTAALHLKQRW